MTTYRPGTHHCAWCAGYASGAREALTEARRRVEALPVSRIVNLSTWDAVQVPDVLAAVDAAAAELGVEPTPEAGTNREQPGNTAARVFVQLTGDRAPMPWARVVEIDGPEQTISDAAGRAMRIRLTSPPTPDTHSAPEAVQRLTIALTNLVDPDPCGDYDHHGQCQAHMATVRGRCAHAAAKELLAELEPKRKADQPPARADEHGETCR